MGASEEAVSEAFAAETEAAIELNDLRPTTAAGLIALVAYAYAADTDGMGWPDGLLTLPTLAQLRPASWQYFLIANLAEILPKLMPRLSA